MEADLVKISFYPTFNTSAETLFNLKEGYLLFYTPNQRDLYEPEPLTEEEENLFPERKEAHLKLMDRYPTLTPFKTDLKGEEIIIISNTINSFEPDDYLTPEVPVIDEMGIESLLLFQDDRIVQMFPDVPNSKQKVLYKEVLKILKEKNTDENNAKIIGALMRYN